MNVSPASNDATVPPVLANYSLLDVLSVVIKVVLNITIATKLIRINIFVTKLTEISKICALQWHPRAACTSTASTTLKSGCVRWLLVVGWVEEKRLAGLFAYMLVFGGQVCEGGGEGENEGGVGGRSEFGRGGGVNCWWFVDCMWLHPSAH